MQLRRYVHVVFSSLIAIHFAIVISYNLKNTNLLGSSLNAGLGFTDHYMNPLFEQNWSMFAPNPPTSTFACLIKYKVIDKGGRVSESEFFDIHDPVVAAGRRTLFSMDQRLLKYMHGCTMNILAKNNAYTALKNKHGMSATSYFRRQSSGYQCLSEYARTVYSTLGLSGNRMPGDSVFFKLKFLNDRFPNFGHRELDFNDPKNHHFYAMETDYSKL